MTILTQLTDSRQFQLAETFVKTRSGQLFTTLTSQELILMVAL